MLGLLRKNHSGFCKEYNKDINIHDHTNEHNQQDIDTLLFLCVIRSYIHIYFLII